jgi:hypothetical protein
MPARRDPPPAAEVHQVGNMSRQEEYYYANDFEGRFGPIMASRANCAD